MLEDLEELITFFTRFGAFKYLIMLFSLCNGPTSWQHLINNTLFNFLHYFVQAYLNNIFNYSKTLKDHYLHVQQVLECLRKVGIQANVNKCKFHIQNTKFFGLIISIKGIQIDPQKVSTIFDWA